MRWRVHLLLVPFALLACVAAFAPLNAIDTVISRTAQRQTWADTLARAVSWVGYKPTSIYAVLVVVVAVFAIGWRRDAVFLGISTGGGWLLYKAIQLLVARPRPTLPIHGAGGFTGPSFPSGHVMNYMALFGFMITVLLRRLQPSPARTAAIVGLAVLIVLVGPARVYLGAHFASDVLGGYALGGWWVLVIATFYSPRATQPSASAS
ncbi:MAG TPA: phosphatase PAP2 family protein [Kofleriaceae bacterium]